MWEVLLLLGFAALFWGLQGGNFGQALALSGSSLFTLGTIRPSGGFATAASFTEAALGLLVLALLITFLPSIYSAFSRREVMVSLLEVRAGTPPSAEQMILRFHRIHGLDQLGDQWQGWERWFAEVEESHTSFPALVFFRSPRPDRSWITAAGAVLDAAALRASLLDMPGDPSSDLCIRAGGIALRRIAEFFQLPRDENPMPDDPIQISRDEFNLVVESFTAAGVPLKSDLDQAWRDFAGWRVNYDKSLISISGLVLAPYAPWSSDRANHRSGRRRLSELGPRV